MNAWELIRVTPAIDIPKSKIVEFCDRWKIIEFSLFGSILRDLQFQDSVVHRLIIIGEASKRVSEAMRQSIPIIPWTAISGMRNRCIHEYDEISLNIVWETIVNNLPNLILELEKIVPPDEEISPINIKSGTTGFGIRSAIVDWNFARRVKINLPSPSTPTLPTADRSVPTDNRPNLLSRYCLLISKSAKGCHWSHNHKSF